MTKGPREPGDPTPQAPGGKSLTKASQAVGITPQEIYEKYAENTSDLLATFNANPRRYGEWTGPTELHDALQRVIDAEQAFLSLPARIRDHVGNDPVAFLELVHDPSRVEELRGLGLLPAGETSPPPGSVEQKQAPDAQ